MSKPTIKQIETARVAIHEERKASTSFVQRRLGIGYNAAANIMEILEADGFISAPDHVGKREILGEPTEEQYKLAAGDEGDEALASVATSAALEADEKSENYRVTAAELRQFVERDERLEQEAKDIGEQRKEVMAEAKSRGYDTKVIKKLVALRKRDKDDIAEEEAVMEMYKEALGMT